MGVKIATQSCKLNPFCHLLTMLNNCCDDILGRSDSNCDKIDEWANSLPCHAVIGVKLYVARLNGEKMNHRRLSLRLSAVSVQAVTRATESGEHLLLSEFIQLSSETTLEFHSMLGLGLDFWIRENLRWEKARKLSKDVFSKSMEHFHSLQHPRCSLFSSFVSSHRFHFGRVQVRIIDGSLSVLCTCWTWSSSRILPTITHERKIYRQKHRA